MKTFFFILLAFSAVAQARTKVAFLKVYDSRGELVHYEPNSQFGHTALQVGELWLQSYPGEGVKLITWQELQHRGVVAEVVEITADIGFQDVKPYLGKPFDFEFTWNNEGYYCSELLAKILQIKPEPMELNREVWPPHYWPLEGQPGMSPDKLYKRLKTPGPYL